MVIYYGNDLDQIRSELSNCSLNIKKILYEGDSDWLLDQINQTSLFNQPDKTIIENAYFLLEDSDKASEVIKTLNNNKIICLVDNDKIDKFNPIIKQLKIKLVKKSKLTSYSKNTELQKLCNELNIEFDNISTLGILLNNLPSNYLLAKSELFKLSIYKPNQKITKKDIQNIIIDNAEANIFKLINLILTNKVSLALNLYDKLIALKHQPSEIIQIISSQFFKIKLYKKNLINKISLDDIAKTMQITPYQIRQFEYIRNIKYDFLQKFATELFYLDCNIKKGLIDPYQSIKIFISTINLNK